MMGIYKIVNKIDGKIYVGSSKDVEFRWKYGHKFRLNRGDHFNHHLQNAWNKYGEQNFEFILLEEVKEEKELILKEQMWIEKMDCCENIKGYNIVSDVAKRSGMKGKKHSKDTKEKMSLAKKGKRYSEESRRRMSISKTGRNNPNYGKKFSESRLKKHSDSMPKGELRSDSKLKEFQVIEIINKYNQGNYSLRSLGKEYGVNKETIRKIICKLMWKHIE